jgi:hypothetical protein
MANFGHLKKLEVSDDSTAKYLFIGIEGAPMLEVRPAHRVNTLFLNEMLKADRRDIRSERNDDESVTDAHLAAVRTKDASIFARCIVTGWSDVKDAKGKQVKFTEKVCVEFLLAIPVDMFDNLRMFCMNIENFRLGAQPMAAKEEEALLGN